MGLVTIHLSPHVFSGVSVFKNVIKNPSNIIHSVESISSNELTSLHQWNRARVVTQGGMSEIQEVRTNMSMYLGVYPEVKDQNSPLNILNTINKELHSCFSACVKHYSEQFCFEIDTEKSKGYTVLKYSTGQQYVNHLDRSERTPRTVSAVGYLNDEYVGGEINFDKINFTYKPSAGDIVVFNSDEPYSHASLPISEGVKYAVVNWW